MIAPLVAVLVFAAPPKAEAAPLPGFHRGPWFREQAREEWTGFGTRFVVNAPADVSPDRPTRLVVFATPNGCTIEQTLGSKPADGADWHFDIQHVAAQVRRLRELCPGENIVLACIEAEGLSWPAWRKARADAPARTRELVARLSAGLPETSVKVTLACHSGGGSFLFAFIDAADDIPAEVERIAFLDANYSYSDAAGHGDKLIAWLRRPADHRLVVIAYDDRTITLSGKPVVGPDGGTFRATRRMLDRFGRDETISESKAGDITTSVGFGGRFVARVHANLGNRILHTALVGNMNGVLDSLTVGRADRPDWGTFGGPRAYTKWVQPAAGIPPRPTDAVGGKAFMASLVKLPPAEREEAIAAEISRGNLPDFLRKLVPITVTAKDSSGEEHTATYRVTPDYLAVGSDADFVRVPMTPMTAQRVADAFGYALPTRKMADDIFKQAAVKLEPRPLVKDREAVETFVQHHNIIEEYRSGQKLGLLVAGIKKDVVATNRLSEKPNKVAIYGWHKLDGNPIQPLTIVHRSSYVDYSHGVRLVSRAVTVDGKPKDLRVVGYAADLCPLVSDEGPLLRPAY